MSFWQKWTKLAACLICRGQLLSDTQRVLSLLTKSEPKLAACLTKCRGLGTGPCSVGRLATSFGARVFGTGSGSNRSLRDRAWIPCQTRSEFWENLRIFPGTRCVSYSDEPSPTLGPDFTRIRCLIKHGIWVKSGVGGGRVAWVSDTQRVLG